MTQNENEKFSELFTNILMNAGIEYASGADGEAYVVYNDFGIMFNITFRKSSNKYIFDKTELFNLECQKYGLPVEAKPDYRIVFETVAFAYKTRQLAGRAKKDFSVLYKDLLIDSDIVFQMRKNFETYMVMNSGFSGYAIGYDATTKKYGFKRYELIDTLYKICDIPNDRKPDFKSLYKRVKDAYMAQTVVECMRDF